MAMGQGDAAEDGEFGEGRHRWVGLREANLRDVRGELHIGACRDLDSGVPGPKRG
jgi:hypothetical protein